MECVQTAWLSDKEYLQRFFQKIVGKRIPISGSLDLTHQCNLNCIHCYLGKQKERIKMCQKEMSTHQILCIIDEITNAGCLHFLITGGEPLLRKDFTEIYRHAKAKGLLITVFTNGTLITREILELFDDLPPRLVEITLYGATAKTHDKITNVKGSFRRCINGIEQLLERKINVGLKTILMTQNRHEFFDIENMAKEFGVKFRFDAAIFPCLDGDKTPVSLRVSPKEAVEKEFANPDMHQQWQEYYKKNKDHPTHNTLYNCGAGLTNFHIDPYGYIQPCVMTTKYKYNILDSSFLSRWENDLLSVRNKKTIVNNVCSRCKNRVLCGFCPAFFDLENGSEYIHSDYLCAMGQYRSEKIFKNKGLKGEKIGI